MAGSEVRGHLRAPTPVLVPGCTAAPPFSRPCGLSASASPHDRGGERCGVRPRAGGWSVPQGAASQPCVRAHTPRSSRRCTGSGQGPLGRVGLFTQAKVPSKAPVPACRPLQLLSPQPQSAWPCQVQGDNMLAAVSSWPPSWPLWVSWEADLSVLVLGWPCPSKERCGLPS